MRRRKPSGRSPSPVPRGPAGLTIRAPSVAGLGEMRRAMLTQLAWDGGALDVDLELIAPSDHDPAHAFHLVSCGADLLVGFAYPERFPSGDERTRERGAKAMMKWAGTPQGGSAAVFLAQAVALLLEELQRRAGHGESADTQRGLRELIQRCYPLDEEDMAVQRDLSKEFRVLGDHVVPYEDSSGIQLPTGYHLALLDPDYWLEGVDNVDDDKNLVEIQERYAGCYLRARANLHAIKMVLPPKEFANYEPQLLRPMGIAYGLEFQLGEATFWKQVIDDVWTPWAQMALGQLAAVPHCPYPEVDRLRLGTQTLLANPDPDRQIPPTAAAALRWFADERTTTDLDSDLILDALIVGYYLRWVEANSDVHNDLDPKSIADIERSVSTMDVNDRGVLVLVAAALTVVEALPRGFSQDEVSWEILHNWGARHAIDRSPARRDPEKLDDEHGLGVTFGQCQEAFDFGYAVGVADEALLPPPAT